jgi:REP element-mobilizing transposase RayT
VPRLARSALSDGYFHVYCRGVASSVIFPAADDRTELFKFLGETTRRFDWDLCAACVLSTHYHLVLHAHVAALSRGMHNLNWRYALYFNERYRLFGHVFAERFQTRAVEGEDRVFDTCAYVLLNPVKAGLCHRVEQWPWSYSRFGLDVS